MRDYMHQWIRRLAGGLLWFFIALGLTVGLFVGIFTSTAVSNDGSGAEPAPGIYKVSLGGPMTAIVPTNKSKQDSKSLSVFIQDHLLSGPAVISYLLSFCVLGIAVFWHRIRQTLHC